MKKVIDVYPYRIFDGEVEFLLFLRSSKKIYANQWRMVGGKVLEDEVSWQAGLRELKEETGLSPKSYWTVPSVNHFYEAKSDQVLLIPAFAAELTKYAEPSLDDEHTSFKWVSIDEVDTYIKWPEQRRLIRLIHQIIINKELLPEWVISLEQES